MIRPTALVFCNLTRTGVPVYLAIFLTLNAILKALPIHTRADGKP
jgi:hypothetical protein